jgi:hypothetical protein
MHFTDIAEEVAGQIEITPPFDAITPLQTNIGGYLCFKLRHKPKNNY